MMHTKRLNDLFSEDREHSQQKKEGVYPKTMTYADFLSFAMEHPEVVRTAHQRAYDSCAEGVAFAKDVADPRLRKIYEDLKIKIEQISKSSEGHNEQTS